MKKRVTSMLLAVLLLCAFCCPVRTEAAMTGNDSYKAVWFSYYDFQNYLKQAKGNNETNFRNYFDKVLDQCLSRGLNRIIVQVRPCSDAMYQSDYFPTSAYIAGKQGAKLSYDPLSVMVAEAHKKGMKIEAWINPYRVSFNTRYSKLAKNNPARVWHESSDPSVRRNVLTYGGQLYYNPSKPEVRTLIINGVREIVRKYDVDGIHMDDYFYPSFSPRNYKKSFDAKEYNASVEKQQGMSIKSYRRQQVDLLVKGIKAAVKEEKPNVVFGISPAGNIDNLNSKYSYYVNIRKWTNSTEYVDYIAPQVYWGFNHRTAPFAKVVDRWTAMVDQSKVKLYIGLPAYKVGHPSLGSNSAERKEVKSTTILKKMVSYVQNKADGVIVVDYADLKKTAAKTMGTALKKITVFGVK